MSEWIDEMSLDNTAMNEVREAVKKWRELQLARMKAEIEFKKADAAYTDYVQKIMTGLLRRNGLESLKCEDGTMISVKTNTKCSIKKDEESRKNVADWLRDHNADALIKEQLIVMPSNAFKLREMNIPYDSVEEMNTNSVKAFILSEMRVNNITINDLPKGLAWYQWDDIEVSDAH